MGLHSSATADKVFKHLKAPPVITKSVFKLKMLGVNISMFCEKLKNVWSVATNLDQMNKNGCEFWTKNPQTHQISYKLQVPKNPVYLCNFSENSVLFSK